MAAAADAHRPTDTQMTTRIGSLKRWAAAALLLLPAGAAGQVPHTSLRPDQAVPPLRQDAQTLREDILRQEAELDLFRRDERQIAAALEAAAQALQGYRRRAAALELELAEINQNIASTEAVAEDLLRRIRAGEVYLSRRLVALYKTQAMGSALPPIPADSLHEWLLRRKALEQVLSYDERTLHNLLTYHSELKQLQERLEHQKAQKQLRLGKHERQVSGAAHETSNREHLLAQIRSRKELQQAVLEALKQNAAELAETINAFNRRERAEIHRPGVPFAAAKGLLIFPVRGKIVKKFGPFNHPKLHVQGFHSGIEVAADRGEPVRAVHAGRVVFANWFKGYGNVLIIDHDDHYYTVHAFLEEVFKSVDSFVAAGEVVATVGDSGTPGIPLLYFELRHRDTPLDPLEWLRLS
ncbi:MAG: peptidoglycan DD-metalloendopeptidase family protein [Desulfobacterales bacterium]